MSNADFVLRFIKQLRAEDEKYPLSPSKSYRLLADHLEYRVAHPSKDRFDIPRTGDEHQDREALATWLENAAHDPPYLAPSWGRSFSEMTGWLVRHSLNFEDKNVSLALSAMSEAHAKELQGDQEFLSVIVEEIKKGRSMSAMSLEMARALDGLDRRLSNRSRRRDMPAPGSEYGPLWQDRPASYLLFLGMRPSDDVQTALTSVSDVLRSTTDHRSIELLLQGPNWKPHLLAAVAVLLSPDRARYAPILWRTFDYGSRVAPQLVVALFFSDPEFCREAKQRIMSRCPVPPAVVYLNADSKYAARAKNIASLLQAVSGLPSEAHWLTPELQHADIQELVKADTDSSGEIVDSWLETVQTQFATFGCDLSPARSGDK